MANFKAGQKAESDDQVSAFTAPKVEVPKAEVPKVEVPEAIRAVAEKSVAQTKTNFETMRASAEETSDRVEESYLSASKGTSELRIKALEATRTNINAAFDFAVALTNAKSLSEAIELQTAHMRKQFEAYTAQSKDLAQIAGKIASETAKPYQDLAQKSLTQPK
jgi:phasin